MTSQVHVMLGSFGKSTGGTNAPYFDGTQPCAETDPEIYFPEKGCNGSEVRLAINICKRCEFQAPCLEYALQEPQEGIWGGTTYQQRKRLRRLRRAS